MTLWFWVLIIWIWIFSHGPTDKSTIVIIEAPVPELKNQNNQKCLILLILRLIELVIIVVFVSFDTLRHLHKIGNGIIAMWPSTMSSLSVYHWPLLIKDAWVTSQLIKTIKTIKGFDSFDSFDYLIIKFPFLFILVVTLSPKQCQKLIK